MRFLLGALLWLWCTAAGAAVALDAKGVAKGQTSSSTSFSTSAMLTIGAALSNGAAVFGCMWDVPITSPSATWAGTSAPLIILETPSGVASVALFGLTAPSSGSNTFSVSWTNSAEVVCSGVSFTGVNQTGGTTSFAHSIGNGAASGVTTETVTVTAASGDYVLAGFNMGQSITAVNNTQVFIDNAVQTLDVNAGMNIVSATGNMSMTATQGTSDFGIGAGVDIVAAAGGGPTCPMTRALMGVGC